jgi:hypothetical protein
MPNMELELHAYPRNTYRVIGLTNNPKDKDLQNQVQGPYTYFSLTFFV